MAVIFGDMPMQDLLDKANFSKEEQKKFLELFEKFQTVPTLEALNAHFDVKINFHKQEVEKLQKQKKHCKEQATVFWECLKINAGR